MGREGRRSGAEARGGGFGWVERRERDVMRERKGGVGLGGESGRCGRLRRHERAWCNVYEARKIGEPMEGW